MQNSFIGTIAPPALHYIHRVHQFFEIVVTIGHPAHVEIDKILT